MLERSNEVINIGEAPFTKLVLDMFKLLIVDKFHYAIVIIIEQMFGQEIFTSSHKNCIYLCTRCMIHLLYDQPSNVVHKLPALSIRNKMFVVPKMNYYLWDWQESMHNIIDSSTSINDTEERNMKEFISKWRSGWS